METKEFFTWLLFSIFNLQIHDICPGKKKLCLHKPIRLYFSFFLTFGIIWTVLFWHKELQWGKTSKASGLSDRLSRWGGLPQWTIKPRNSDDSFAAGSSQVEHQFYIGIQNLCTRVYILINIHDIPYCWYSFMHYFEICYAYFIQKSGASNPFRRSTLPQEMN